MLNKILDVPNYDFLSRMANSGINEIAMGKETLNCTDVKEDQLFLVVAELNDLTTGNIKIGSVGIKLSPETMIKSGLENEPDKVYIYFDVMHSVSGGEQFGVLQAFNQDSVEGGVILLSSNNVTKLLPGIDENYLKGQFDISHYTRAGAQV